MICVKNLNKADVDAVTVDAQLSAPILTLALVGALLVAVLYTSNTAPEWGADSPPELKAPHKTVGYRSRFIRFNEYLFNGKEGATAIATATSKSQIINQTS